MKRLKESSACVVARIVVCSSSPSPERKRSTEVEAFLPTASTSWMALDSTSWNPPAPPGWPAGRISWGSVAREMGRMGKDIFSCLYCALAAQVEGALNHVFDRGDGRDVGPIAPRGAHQVPERSCPSASCEHGTGPIHLPPACRP